MLLLTGWIGDGAAYYVGKNFGRHKAMPNVSPNKVMP
jgi:CDP-diglyceride synthetase